MVRAKKTSKKTGKHVLGIDLGGTKILTAVVTQSGEVISRAKKKTQAKKSTAVILDRLAMCCRDAVEAAGMNFKQISGIGIGSPGPLDPIKGEVIETPNMNLTGAPITAHLEKQFKVPTFLDNDVNIGTLGEFTYGAGKGKKHVVGIFLGTGVGGGVIVDGKLLHGFSLNAGELGHMKLVVGGDVCGCGLKGCLEAYASKTAIIRRMKKAVDSGKPTILTDLIGSDWTKLTSKVFKQAVADNDKLVKTEIRRAAKYTGIGVGSLLNILSPEVVVIGGGLVEALEDEIMPLVRRHAERNCFPIVSKGVQIVPAKLGDDAGILGAAALAWQRLGEKK